MSGLEKIIQEIINESEAEAASIIQKAQAQADEIVSKAKAESDALAARIVGQAKLEVRDIEASQASALVLQRRQRLLQTKQTLLAETLEKALAALYALPQADYFRLLVKLAAGAAEPSEGEMLLNEADKNRLPASFETDLAAALPKGATLAVSAQTRPIDGGFVLKYGDIEQNCSFRAMFDARRDEFSDLVRDTLFEG